MLDQTNKSANNADQQNGEKYDFGGDEMIFGICTLKLFILQLQDFFIFLFAYYSYYHNVKTKFI